MRPRLAPGGAGGRSRANETNDNYDPVAHPPRDRGAVADRGRPVRSVYNRYNQGSVLSGLTGGEAAALILRRVGIHDVEITHHDDMLGDHYDPLHKRLVLSSANYFGSTPAALGVAAHECGHALQHARPASRCIGASRQWGSPPMQPGGDVDSTAGIATGLIAPIVGATILAVAWGIIMLFNLVTLPVEFDASRRAKAVLARMGLIAPGAEAAAVSKVLNAAAWTYVAAFITSLVYFLWHLLPLLTGRQRD